MLDCRIFVNFFKICNLSLNFCLHDMGNVEVEGLFWNEEKGNSSVV